jgi:SAM-dependent methyltransferase
MLGEKIIKINSLIKKILLKINPVYRIVNNTQLQLENIQNSMIEKDKNNQILAENLEGLKEMMIAEVNKIQEQLMNMQKNIILPDFLLKQNGFCPICNQNTIFISKHTWLRDNFICSNCGSIPRQRALMMIIEKYYPNWKNLCIHESSPGEGAITKKFQNECKEYVASHFYQQEELGIIIDGYRNENLEKQTFENEIFDIVITQDVFEHIYNPEKAFSEIARTLKHGGSHIFTVPIINKFNKTETWAKQDINGETIFLKNEEWHGNPIDKKGVPVTMHWGFDIIDYIKKYTGINTIIEYPFNLSKGIWAEYIEVFVSKKD